MQSIDQAKETNIASKGETRPYQEKRDRKEARFGHQAKQSIGRIGLYAPNR
jgi:hypothetical protein